MFWKKKEIPTTPLEKLLDRAIKIGRIELSNRWGKEYKFRIAIEVGNKEYGNNNIEIEGSAKTPKQAIQNCLDIVDSKFK